jgi:hypothetical protein
VPLFDKFLLGPPLPAGGRHSDKLMPPKAAGFGDPETAKKLKALDAAIAAAAAERAKVPSVMVPADGRAADVPVLVRGNPATPGPVVPRGVPSLGGAVRPQPAVAGSGRKEFAEWVASADNPLTARVIVNRVWLWHFGEGLVRSPDNFGVRGERPSHPELLDWLAGWLIDNGWSVKKLHTLICTSEAYQQATGVSPAADPENRLLTHWNRRRLDAEDIRDGMLAAAGTLDPTAGGSIMDVLNRTYANGGSAPPDIVKRMHYDSPRRAVYLPVVRNAVYDLFAAFDYPEPGTPTGQRSATTVPQQALYLMNSPFVASAAKAFAARVRKLAGDDAGRVRAAYELALCRPPSAAEASAAAAFLGRDADALAAAGDADPRAAAWARLCHALLVSNEFLYLR